MCVRLCSNLGGGYMLLDKNGAKEIGEALIDAAEQVHKHSNDQAVIMLSGRGLAVPLHPDMQSQYETIAIVKV